MFPVGILEIKENSLFTTFAADRENRRSAETVSGSGKGSREKKEGLSDRFSETDRNKRNFKQNGAGLSGCAGGCSGSRSSGWDAMSGMWFCSSSEAHTDSEEVPTEEQLKKQKKLTEAAEKAASDASVQAGEAAGLMQRCREELTEGVKGYIAQFLPEEET